MKKNKKIVFVCLGNICRSPMGEGAMKYWVEEKRASGSYFIDSAGTSAFHVGEKADHRMRDVAFSHGIKLTSRARQFVKEDLEEFDYIIAMDESNYRNIVNLDPSNEFKVFKLREFDNEAFGDLNVPDPYYGGIEGFDQVYHMVMRSCERLLEKIKE